MKISMTINPRYRSGLRCISEPIQWVKELARAQITTILLKLLKIGATILRNKVRIRFCSPTLTLIKRPFKVAARRKSD